MLPETSPKHYISGLTALNVPFPEEGNGDWHFHEAFFGRGNRKPKITLAGEGESVNTNPLLGTEGIYECADKLKQLGVEPIPHQKVYVAGHYRAILDMLYKALQRGCFPSHLDILGWFETEAQLQTLKQKTQLLMPYLNTEAKELLNQWLETF